MTTFICLQIVMLMFRLCRIPDYLLPYLHMKQVNVADQSYEKQYWQTSSVDYCVAGLWPSIIVRNS